MVEASARTLSAPSIGTTAVVVGGISFAAGYVGPVLFSDSNLGPLLGIFVTGPLGLLVGALVGVLLSARTKAGQSLERELKWLAGCWLGALAFTLAASIGSIGWLSITAQTAVILGAGLLFYMMPAGLPSDVRRWRLAILLGLVLDLLASMFPPATGMGDALKLRFFLDPGFDASTRVPDFAVDQTILLAEWFAITGIVALLILADRARAAR